MDVDAEIAPLCSQSDVLLSRIKKELLPLIAVLDEDTVVSHYPLEAQARLYLSSAFTLAFSLYALDKLNHHTAFTKVKISGSEKLNTSVSGNVDPQLLLKIERITDYIKKLKEITTLSRQQAEEDKEDRTNDNKKGAKRPREETEDDQKEASGHSTTTAAPTMDADNNNNDMGDAAMFSVVTRVPGETGVLVSRLLRQANPRQQQ